MSTRRIVLISGASTGIGRAMALHLSSRGFDVFAGVRKRVDADALSRESSGKIHGILLDVTEPETISQAIDLIQSRAGEDGLCGLVNNAGIGVFGPSESIPLDDWRRQFEVNLFGTIALTHACLPLLRTHVERVGPGAARIVQISSIAAHFGQPILSPYSASKAALRSWSEALRVELHSQGIRVSMIEPGPVKSEIWGKAHAANASSVHITPAIRSRYAPMIDAVIRIARQSEAKAVDANVVAYVVERALSSRTPFLRRLVTRDAHLAALAHWLLPERWFHRAAIRITNAR